MTVSTRVLTQGAQVRQAVEQVYRDVGLLTDTGSRAGSAQLGTLDNPPVTVWIDDIYRVECIVGDRSFSGLVGSIETLASQGWEVVVLLPLQDLGEAHRQLRGSSVSLQGWWIDEAEVRFSRPQTP